MNKNNYIKTPFNNAFILNRADPYVYRHSDGTYYFTASVPEYDRIVLRRSDSLEGLQTAEEKTLWVKHEEGPQSIHIWAPEIHFLFGKWYIYYGAGDKADKFDTIRPYCLECEGEDPMTGTWTELGVMQGAEDDPFVFQDFSLDGTVYNHKDEWYYIWAEKSGTGKKISHMYMGRLEAANRLKDVHILLTTPDYDWERIDFWVNEGPAVIRHEDKVFVFFSASATGACYCMGYLWAYADSDLMDPRSWNKTRYPILKTDEEKQIYGPGHCSFTKSEDGSKDICVYHARPYDEIIGDPLYDINRHAMLLTMDWDSEGFPILEYPVNR